ncbi:MAG: hypothetical protein PHF60_03705 [Candidatus ainarchaeum sp.]|nr:hypothetical protein [Candidatus ainarchaeum sp.]
MKVEFEPELLNRTLLSSGLSEQQVREIGSDFSKNGFVMEDEALLDKLLEAGKDMPTIIGIFSKIGIGKENTVRMIEIRQKKRLGPMVQVHTLKVEE